MPFRRPTLGELIKRAQASFDAKLPGADARLKQSILNVCSAVLGGVANGIYGYLDYVAQNLLPNGQDSYFLLRTGQLYGLAPMPSVAASGNANFTGIATTNVPSGTELKDSGGNLYKTTATVALGVGDTLIPVLAKFGGEAGNLEAGSPLTLTMAIAGVDAVATVDGDGFTGGLDAEDVETDFRARVLARIQTPPGGSGTVGDYARWARTALPDLTRVTVEGALRGAGTVDVRFVCDNRPDPIPTSPDLVTVQAALEANAPLTDVPGILAIAPVPVDVDYVLAVARFSTPTQQAAAQQALVDLHLSLAIGEGLALQGKVIPALSAVPANDAATMVSTPNADIAADPTKVLMLGTVAFA